MTDKGSSSGEGSLEAPVRHPLNWQTDESFFDEASLMSELERVYDICHGCRRCFNLCNAFPTLFDAIDDSDTMELDGVDKKVYWDVVDHCYLCDMCFMTKCPYVPPHEWNLDFPHLMLRAKAVRYKKEGAKFRDKLLTSTDTVGNIAGIPVVSSVVNAANNIGLTRQVLKTLLGVHPDAVVPKYHSNKLRKQAPALINNNIEVESTEHTKGRVVLFTTCYGNVNAPEIGIDLIKVFQHNSIEVRLADREQCCGMPKLELGDLDAVQKAKNINIPELLKYVKDGWDIVGPIPSCVLMFKQELPLLFPDDKDVAAVADAIYDPFEYLMLRHKSGKLKTDFKTPLGKIAYHVACHLRVQNMGNKTRDCLQLVPDTNIETIERCSGHDGTYAVKTEFHKVSMKICKPIVTRVEKSECDYYSSDCPMAGHQIANGLKDNKAPTHPLSLLRIAYGL